MINSYKRTLIFEVDGYKEEDEYIILEVKENIDLKERIIAKGNTFESLWCFIKQNEELTFEHFKCEPCGIFSKKRRIIFSTCLHIENILTWVDNGSKLEWKIFVIDKPYKITIKELAEQDADTVIKYFKDRNFKGTININ